MELHVAQADILTLEVDAVVIPCTSMGTLTGPMRDLLGAAPVASIEQELKAKLPLALGAAMLADASAFKANAAVLVPIKKEDEDTVATEHLRRAIKAALVAANVKHYTQLAVPSWVQLGDGTTRAEAARAIVQEMHRHKQSYPEKIYLVAENEDMVAIFEDAIENARRSL